MKISIEYMRVQKFKFDPTTMDLTPHSHEKTKHNEQ